MKHSHFVNFICVNFMILYTSLKRLNHRLYEIVLKNEVFLKIKYDLFVIAEEFGKFSVVKTVFCHVYVWKIHTWDLVSFTIDICTFD